MPVFAVDGAQGNGTASLKSLHITASDVRSVVVDRCGHFISEEQPEELNPTASRLLRRREIIIETRIKNQVREKLGRAIP